MTTLGQVVVSGQGLRIAGAAQMPGVTAGPGVVVVPGAAGSVPPWEQTTPATVWGPIVHRLGRRPAAVSLFSADYGQQYSEYVVQHLDENTLRISMDTPTTGIALID